MNNFTKAFVQFSMTSVVTVIEALFLTFIWFGALFGNILLFVVVAKSPRLQTKGNVFILNLAAADLLVSVISLPITLVTVVSEGWILGKEVCLISGFITLLTFVASCMALSMISINRYHAIVHWTTYQATFTRRKCALYICMVWGITIGLSIPPFFGWASFDYHEGQSYCFAKWTDSKSYTIFMIAVCLFGPLVIMGYCYVKIIQFKKKSKRDIQRSARPSCETLNSTNTELSVTVGGRVTADRNEQRLTRTVVLLIVVFAFCWSPFALIMVIDVFVGADVPRAIEFGSLVLGYANSFCNVLIYSATSNNVKQCFRKLLCPTRNTAEINSRTTVVISGDTIMHRGLRI